MRDEINTNIFGTLFGKDDFFKPVYFRMDVLDRYFKNPQYLVNYTDYRGSIHLKDRYASDNLADYETIKNFGIAYHKEEKYKRAIVTFANDLVNMPVRIQGFWYAHMIENQNEYVPNVGFVKNLIYGEWVDDISIFQALLMEMHYINEMCCAMKIPSIFRKEYRFDTSCMEDRPLHYHDIFLPTRDNYYNFINTMEKLVVSNICFETFLKDAIQIKKIDRKRDNGTLKETIEMMEEWLKINVPESEIDKIIMPLRGLRKLRQRPAHELYQNEYDETIWKDQGDKMHDVYKAVRSIRVLFANHPLAKIVIIPEVLFIGKNIVIY